VAVEILNPELADIAVSRAREIFIPRLTMGYQQESQNSGSYSWIDAAQDVSTTSNGYETSLSQLIPLCGEFSVSLQSYEIESNRKFQTINPRFGSTLNFSFSQPLLRSFGFLATQREIIVARTSRDISEARLSARSRRPHPSGLSAPE
jgi:hypothetical protein